MDRIYHFSAPGRTEIGGNHTDHQCGCVLAAAVDMETTAQVRLNGTDTIRVDSEGYPPVTVRLNDLSVREEEKNTTASLVRGVAASFAKQGYHLEGFDARVRSTVLPGSGLSSSAAFEVLMGRILNGLFAAGEMTPVQIARIGQYAENVYFGKPSGLMDQMASSVGGMVFMDFADPLNPEVEQIRFPFADCGFTLCTVNSGADHRNLTDAYAAIPRDMKRVAALFGAEVLADVREKDFYADITLVREQLGDRAALRAMHFFEENRRVRQQVCALHSGNFRHFLELVNASGISSWTLLQNVAVSDSVCHQQMAFTIALCQRLLNGRGAVRVHGGGFAGTALAFVPSDDFPAFRADIEAVLGEGSCRSLKITE